MIQCKRKHLYFINLFFRSSWAVAELSISQSIQYWYIYFVEMFCVCTQYTESVIMNKTYFFLFISFIRLGLYSTDCIRISIHSPDFKWNIIQVGYPIHCYQKFTYCNVFSISERWFVTNQVLMRSYEWYGSKLVVQWFLLLGKFRQTMLMHMKFFLHWFFVKI